VPIKRECASVAALDKPLRLAIVADEAPCAIASCAGFGFSAGAGEIYADAVMTSSLLSPAAPDPATVAVGHATSG
jgi:hypothetical protein